MGVTEWVKELLFYGNRVSRSCDCVLGLRRFTTIIST